MTNTDLYSKIIIYITIGILTYTHAETPVITEVNIIIRQPVHAENQYFYTLISKITYEIYLNSSKQIFYQNNLIIYYLLCIKSTYLFNLI